MFSLINFMKFIKISVYVLLFSAGIYLTPSCQNTHFGLHADSLFLVTDNQEFFYEVKYPDKKYFLPYVLEEISGLSWKEGNLLAIDDETGKIFEYSLKEKKIVHTISFYKGGDFEGIEKVRKNVYVLKSNGDIFRIPYSSTKKSDGTKIQTALSKKNDTEGLGYDPSHNQLIIACKEKAETGQQEISGKAFYAFDLNSLKLNTQPIFTISKGDLKRFWESKRDHQYDKDRIKFKPSAIALHPKSNEFYILSSVGKMIVVVNRKGIVKATYPLSSRVLSQPEGISFSPNGDMYLSSEGDGDKGYILEFKMRTKR